MAEKSRVLGVCLLAMCFALSAGPAAAQSQAGTGTIVGTVFDSSGAVVPGARVSAQGKGTGLTRDVTANTEGQYRIILLPPGAYTLTVAHSGFKTYKAEIEVNVGATPTLDIRLAVGAAAETIEVTASVVVESTTSVSDALINEKAIDSLPINGRRFHDFVQLTPTVQIEPSRSGISFAGQRGINANVTIDGADYNQPFFGGIRGGERGNNAFSIPQEAIQEFQVVAHGVSAEFGRTTSGLVNAVTKSGSNDWHGSGFYYGRYDSTTANDAFNRKSIDNQHQFGGSFGGPIAQDRAFFFFTPEFQQKSAPRAVVLQALAGRTTFNAEAYDFYDSLQESFVSTDDAKAILGKVDFKINANHQAFVRYHWSTNTGENAVATGDGVTTTTNNAVSNDGTEGDKTQTVTGRWIGLFSSTMVNELRAQWAREERPRTANALMTSVANTIGNYGTRNFLPTTQDDDRIQIADSLNWTSGKHNWKFGGDFNWLRAAQFFKFDQFGAFLSPATPTGCSTVSFLLGMMSVGTDPALGACDVPNRFDHANYSYRVNIGNGDQGIEAQELAFFVQDTWRVHPRFTITAGLRWEGYFNPTPDVSNTAMYNAVKNAVFPIGRTVDPAIFPDQTKQWAPQLGFAWDPRGDSKTVIRANARIGYARNPLLLYAGPLNNFRLPPGDLRTTIPFRAASGVAFTGCSNSPVPGANPATVPMLVAGDTCNTMYWQMRRIGIDMNTTPLNNLPALTPANLTAMATALGLPFDPFLNAAPIALANNYESPRSLNWSFGFDREVARGWSMGAEFVYVNTVHLQRNRDYNLPTPSVCPDVNSSTTVVTQDMQLRPIFHLTGGTGSGCPNGTGFTGNPSLSRPIASLGSVQVRETNARALYRGLTLRSVLRRSKWQLQTYYTLSKNFTDDDNERDSGGQLAANAFNLLEDYGYSRLDARHLLLVNGLYDLPWNFQVSALGRFRSGRPVDAIVNSDTNEDGFFSERPFIAPGVQMPRNNFRDRAVYNFDLRISKKFKLGEKARFDVTADFFNFFKFDNVTFNSTSFTPRAYGVGIDRVTGASPTIPVTFMQLRNGVNCSTTLSTGAVNPSYNPGCYSLNNRADAPFQMQIGFRFQF